MSNFVRDTNDTISSIQEVANYLSIGGITSEKAAQILQELAKELTDQLDTIPTQKDN